MYIERFGDQMVRFSSFAIKKTGLQQSLTHLQLEDYVLICSPFQLSMRKAIMLLVLSQEEAAFFQKFQGKLCRLSFSFLRPGTKTPISFFVRATLDRIAAVKGRPNVCMADLSFKACPNDLAQVLGDYITAFAVLKTQFITFKNQLVDVNENSAPFLGINPELDAQFGQLKVKAHVLSLGVNRAVLVVPDRTPNLAEGLAFGVRFAFVQHQFSATLTVRSVHEGSDKGYRKLACEMEFVPEMVEVMDTYYHNKRAG